MLLLFFYNLSNISGQYCTWAKTGNGDNYNYGSSVATDAQGNVYMTGHFKASILSFGSQTLANTGDLDAFLVKYSPSGTAIWARSGEGWNTDYGYSVCTDPSGNPIIAGIYLTPTLSFGSYTINNAGTANGYVVKYDPNGNVLWAKSVGSYSVDNIFSVSSDSQGDIYIAGACTSSIVTVGSNTFTITDTATMPRIMLLIKYSGTDGSVLWARSATGNAAAYGVHVDKQNNIYVTGEYYSSTVTIAGTTLTCTDSDPDFFIAKYDASGNGIWVKRGSNRYGYSVCTNDNNDVFVLGNYDAATLTIGTYTFSNPGGGGGGTSNFLVSYDSGGNIKWVKNFGNQGGCDAYSVATDVSNIYITGDFYPYYPLILDTYTVSVTVPASDALYFARLDFSGNVVYAAGFKSGGGGGNNHNGVCTDDNGNVYVGSDFNINPLVIDSQTLTLTGTRNVFLAKFHFDDVGIKENQTNYAGSILYPNPNNGTFTIKFQEGKREQNVEISIFDITGRLVWTEKRAGGTEFQLKNDLQNGMYLVKVKFEDGTYDVHHLIISK